jgi:hypothetical protein
MSICSSELSSYRVSQEVIDSEYFSEIVDFGELLNTASI